MLNSPHNPTGGVATREDLAAIADVVRGTELMVFSDEPYCHMVWGGTHASILAQPGMLEHTVAAYTFSKSYSMSGWRIGFAVAAPELVDAIGKLINTTASCSPPLAQRAAQAALESDAETRDDYMERFRRKVVRLCEGLERDRRFPRASGPPGRSTSSRTSAPSATGWGSPRTAWPSTCSKAPTMRSASPAWAANASATPAAASSASVAPSPTNASTRPSPSSPPALERTDRVRRYLEANPRSCWASPIPSGDRESGTLDELAGWALPPMSGLPGERPAAGRPGTRLPDVARRLQL